MSESKTEKPLTPEQWIEKYTPNLPGVEIKKYPYVVRFVHGKREFSIPIEMLNHFDHHDILTALGKQELKPHV